MLRYLDDWLVQASSREEVLRARDKVLELCQALGIIINFDKSHLVPTQIMDYLGIRIDATLLRASPVPERIDKLTSVVEEFLSYEKQPAWLWRKLLGHLSSLTQLVPGGQLRMRAVQLALRSQWDFRDEEVLIEWNLQCRLDLQWWTELGRLEQGCHLEIVPPDLMFWSDASDQGWGAHLQDK